MGRRVHCAAKALGQAHVTKLPLPLLREREVCAEAVAEHARAFREPLTQGVPLAVPPLYHLLGAEMAGWKWW